MKIQFNPNVYPGSRISKLPRHIQSLALFVRNIKSIPRQIFQTHRFRHEFDGMGTIHDMAFLEDVDFHRHQERAILAGGYDYGIPLRLHQAIWCAKHANKLGKDGIFVELGTGRGFVMSAICSALSDDQENFLNRKIFLFDTFIPYRIGENGKQEESLGINPHYTESFEAVQENFKSWSNVTLVRGDLPNTLKLVTGMKIGFLHIDLNFPSVEIECLEKLWDSILPGAPILIDDYAYTGYQETLRAFNKFAHERDFAILTTATGQGIAIKPA